MLVFDWDQRNRTHLARHKVTPEEAEQVILNDPLNLEREMRNGELRLPHLGETNAGRVLIVVATSAGDKVRVVTSWPANKLLRAFWRTQVKGGIYGR